MFFIFVFFFKQKTAYEMRISDWSSDVCSSDLHNAVRRAVMGDVDRLPTSEEQAKMEGLVTAAMKAGAYGLSDGPFYIPAKYSNTAEIIGLARAAAPFPHAI